MAREIVGEKGLVVSVEIDPLTLAFAENNLRKTGYCDIVLIQGDGGLGYQEKAPYDRICITVACDGIPPPLLAQLKMRGRLIAPIKERGVQNLVLLAKGTEGFEREVICQVLYISLRGKYGNNW